MNFDELKSQWNEKKEEALNIPDNIESIKRVKHPVDIIKKNMKKEFIYQLIAIGLIAVVPFLIKLNKDLYTVYYMTYVILIIISAYYFYQFYRFYSSTQFLNCSTKSSLMNLYYNLKLNIERYKSFSFLLLPFVYFLMGIILYSQRLKYGVKEGWLNIPLATLVFITVITIIIIVLALIWINYFYGRYAKQIKDMLEELSDEEM